MWVKGLYIITRHILSSAKIDSGDSFRNIKSMNRVHLPDERALFTGKQNISRDNPTGPFTR